MARYRELPTLAFALLMLGTVASVFASVYMIFGLGNQLKVSFGIEAYVPIEEIYFFFMIAVLLPLAFLIFPTGSPRDQGVSLSAALFAAIAVSAAGGIVFSLVQYFRVRPSVPSLLPPHWWPSPSRSTCCGTSSARLGAGHWRWPCPASS